MPSLVFDPDNPLALLNKVFCAKAQLQTLFQSNSFTSKQNSIKEKNYELFANYSTQSER